MITYCFHPPPRLMCFIKNKITYVLGALFFITVLTSAVSIWRFGLVPLRHSIVCNTKLHLKFMKINKNIERLKTKTRLIIYYEKVKPLNYRYKLKQTLNKTEILVGKIDSGYKNTAAFIKKTAPYANYDPKIVKIFEKSYFQWETFGKPDIKNFIKYPVYIAPITSYRLFSKYILMPVSSSVMPSITPALEALSYFKYIINMYFFVFILGTIIIIMVGILLAYYFSKLFIVRKSEQRLKTFFSKLPVPSLIVNVESGLIIDANKKAVEFYGYSKEEFTHMTIAVINPFISIEEKIDFMAKSLNEGYNFAIFKHKLKNGEIRDVEAHISGIIYDNKPYVQAIITDITEKIKAQKRVERLFNFNAALAKINQLIAESTDEKEMLKSVCELAVKYARLKLAYIGRPDENEKLRFLASAGEVGYLDGIFISVSPDIPEGQGTSGRTWREGKMYYAQSFMDSSFLSLWKERAERFGIKSTANLPVYRNGKIWGLFGVYHPEENIFDEDLKILLEEIAKNMSRGLDRIDVLIREHELMAAQEALLGNTIAGISITDRRRLYINLNDRFAEIFGYGSKDELLGQSARLLYFDDEEYNRVGEFYKNIFLEKKTATISPIYFKRKDGTAIWCEMSGSPVSVNGQDAAIWTLYDITEKKLLEDKLKKSEELFRTLADNMPEGLDMHTEKFIYANPSLQAKLGYSEEELKNMFFWDILAEEHKETAKDAIKKGLADINYKHYVTFKVFKKTGEELWMYIYAGPAIYKGKRVRIATFTDITELVQLRKRLEKEKESYKNISEKDDLTGIFNRRKFKSSLERQIKIASRYKRPLSLVMFDIDRFKEINDNFGHQAGDSVLCELTALVVTALRDTDILARYGGEEFMVIMPETDINDAENIAERIRKNVENSIFKYTTSVTISLGVGRYADGEDADGFIKRVDGALYKAKQGGRNRVCVS